MPTKTILTTPFASIERRFELIGYRWFDGTWKAAVIRKDDGTSQIRVLISRRGNSDRYGYFEINADGIITASPRGYARDYNGTRITGLDDAIIKYATDDPTVRAFAIGA
jgi:hypothetical protein